MITASEARSRIHADKIADRFNSYLNDIIELAIKKGVSQVNFQTKIPATAENRAMLMDQLTKHGYSDINIQRYQSEYTDYRRSSSSDKYCLQIYFNW